MKILIVGTGYVGLVTGACFAEMGHGVTCLDIDHDKIHKLQRGEIPLFEPGLEELVKRNAQAKRLQFTTDYTKGVQDALFCFLALPTPSSEDGSCDLSYVLQAAKTIAQNMDGYRVIINKSTVPVGSAEEVRKVMQGVLNERGVDYPFDVVSNPEFLKEGDAINDFMKPDRIVIGTDNAKVTKLMQELYAPFNLSRDRVLTMNIPSAEMTKYAANAMLATRISFMNEIANVCEKVGADVQQVRRGIGSDGRIGYSFLYAGVGYGGSCFPKDVKALGHTAKSYGVKSTLIDATEEVNARQKEVLGKKMLAHFGSLTGKTVGMWGLSFKPGTDDMREAPSLQLIDFLLKQGAMLRLFDPVSMRAARRCVPKSPQITWCESELEAAKNADAIALVTEWKQFRLIDFAKVKAVMQNALFFDGRNQYCPKEMERSGFTYYGIGIGASVETPVFATATT